ncbi:TolB family protein [Catellatospora vulcania]|uniref:TolB family protein n=1 Tax=Catellatospora vulcania TaxID=1460450 RepID=UPI0012D47816|nr:hypothetical protein [Catellatospora vulcania]
MTDLEQRLRAAIRAIADEPDVALPPRPAVTVRLPWLRRYAVPAVAALAVVVAIFAITLPQPGGTPHRPAAGSDEVFLPDEIAGLSLLTATVSDAPLGQPAMAVLHQGNLGTTWGSSQVVVIAADGRTYRRLDLAEQRGALAADGEWVHAQTRLAPDGRLVAIGDPHGGATDIAVLDLVTGRRHDYPLARPSAYRLLGWSPDGRTLALLAVPGATRDIYETEPGGLADLVVLDLATGALATVSQVPSAVGEHYCFTGDGRAVVAGVRDDEEPGFTLYPIDGSAKRTVPVPAAWRLAGCAPDGSLLVTQPDTADARLRLVSATDGAVLRETRLPQPVDEALAWRSASTPILYAPSWLAEGATGRVLAAPFDGQVTTLSTADEGWFSRVTVLELAAALAGDAAPTGAGPERGPWPVWARVVTATLVVLAGAVLVLRRRRRTATSEVTA